MSEWPKAQPAVYTAIAILREALPGVTVGAKTPTGQLGTCVRVTRAGGTRAAINTDVSWILVQCYAPITEVEDLCATCSQALSEARATFVDGVWVRGWDGEQGPVDFPDPDVTHLERWQFHGHLNLSTVPLDNSS